MNLTSQSRQSWGLLLMFAMTLSFGCHREATTVEKLSPVELLHQSCEELCEHYENRLNLMRSFASAETLKSKSAMVEKWFVKDRTLASEMALAFRKCHEDGVWPDQSLMDNLSKRADAANAMCKLEGKRIDGFSDLNILYEEDDPLHIGMRRFILPIVEETPLDFRLGDRGITKK